MNDHVHGKKFRIIDSAKVMKAIGTTLLIFAILLLLLLVAWMGK